MVATMSHGIAGVSRFLRKEFMAIWPVFLFFLIGFLLLFLLVNLVLARFSIEIIGLSNAMVGALIAAAAILELRQPPAPSLPPEVVATAKQLNEQEVDVRNMHLASTSPVDRALEQNLKEIDDFIADCERHLKQAPQDELAREYLYNAYQQKAELLAAMLDRGRSVN